MAEPRVTYSLKRLYGRWLGELEWIEAPPKTMRRPSRRRDKFLDEAPLRAARADEIRRGLPCIAYVIAIYDPDWRPEMAKAIRPSAKRAANQAPGPPQGWTAAALDVLREADTPLSMAEIVEEIGERYDLDLGDVAERQRRHTAVNNGLRRAHSARLVAAFGVKERWQMLRTLEDTFFRLVGKPYTVLSAVVIPRGDGYLFCGSGIYGTGQGEGGVFVFDTNDGGLRTLSAQRAQFAQAGCNSDLAMTLR